MLYFSKICFNSIEGQIKHRNSVAHVQAYTGKREIDVASKYGEYPVRFILWQTMESKQRQILGLKNV